MGAPQLVAMVAVDLINRQGNVSRAIAPTILAALALIATVAVLSDDSSVAFESSDQNLAIRSNQKVSESSQLQNFDLAIQRVDQGIRASSTQLVGHSQKLITQQRIAQQERNTLIKEQGIAAAERMKLVQAQKVVLREKARSHAMKIIRFKLAQKQKTIMQERHNLQVHSLQLAQLQQRARQLLSPTYTPTQAELQAVASAGTPTAPIAALSTPTTPSV